MESSSQLQQAASEEGNTSTFPHDFILPMPGQGVGCRSLHRSFRDINVTVVSMGSALKIHTLEVYYEKAWCQITAYWQKRDVENGLVSVARRLCPTRGDAGAYLYLAGANIKFFQDVYQELLNFNPRIYAV